LSSENDGFASSSPLSSLQEEEWDVLIPVLLAGEKPVYELGDRTLCCYVKDCVLGVN